MYLHLFPTCRRRGRLSTAGYTDVQWVHDINLPLMICNGIVVEERHAYGNQVEISEGLSLIKPSVSVFDPDGHLPLNLQRTGLAVKELPFEDQLRESQCGDFIAWALVNAPTRPANLAP
jgi:molecular chaperone HtpG